MRLLRYGPANQERPAVEVAGIVYDVSHIAMQDFGPSFFSSGGLDRLRAGLVDAPQPRVEGALGRVGPPIARPGKIVCIGLNYAGHAAEAGLALPREPVVFLKAPNAIVGPEDEVLLPIDGLKTDWEIELGIVIGSQARYLEHPEDGAAAIAGYCISNDISERSFQLERGGQWAKGKSCETFNPLGPWLVTPGDLGDVGSLSMWLDVNGERMQDSNTEDMIFSPSYLIWYLSQLMVLEPGDLVNTGTPAGVGYGAQPARYLAEGDVIELGIEGLGMQRLVCRRATR